MNVLMATLMATVCVLPIGDSFCGIGNTVFVLMALVCVPLAPSGPIDISTASSSATKDLNFRCLSMLEPVESTQQSSVAATAAAAAVGRRASRSGKGEGEERQRGTDTAGGDEESQSAPPSTGRLLLCWSDSAFFLIDPLHRDTTKKKTRAARIVEWHVDLGHIHGIGPLRDACGFLVLEPMAP